MSTLKTTSILAGKLRALRIASGKSGEAWFQEVGGETDSSASARSQVNAWESGGKRPSLDRLLAIAKVSGCSLDWLLDDEVPVEAATSTRAADSTPERSEDRSLVSMLAKQQDLLGEQQAMLARQQLDVSRLTELLAKQQEFQHRYATEQMERLHSEIGALRGELERYRTGAPEDPVATFQARLQAGLQEVAQSLPPDAKPRKRAGDPPSPAER